MKENFGEKRKKVVYDFIELYFLEVWSDMIILVR